MTSSSFSKCDYCNEFNIKYCCGSFSPRDTHCTLKNQSVSESTRWRINFEVENNNSRNLGALVYPNDLDNDLSVESFPQNQVSSLLSSGQVFEYNIKETPLTQNFVEENQPNTSLSDFKALLNNQKFDCNSNGFDFNQYTRRNNLEIVGVPCTQGEYIFDLLKQIAREIGVPFNRQEMSIAYRQPLPKSYQLKVTCHPFIIVSFKRMSVKEIWRKASKERRLLASDLMEGFPSTRIYLNDHLTTHNKTVLGIARKYVQRKMLAFAWSFNCKILVKKTQASRAIRVYSVEQVDAIAQSTNQTPNCSKI